MGGGAPLPTTWNPADKSPDLTLSNSNLTATLTVGAPTDENVRSIASLTSGKIYWEIICTNTVLSGSFFTGVSSAAFVLSGLLGATASSCAYASNGFYTGRDDANQPLPGNLTVLPAYTTADVVCIAFDVNNKKIWFRKNGGNWNNDVIANQNPANNIGGFDMSGIADPYFADLDVERNTEAGTAVFSSTAWSFTAPAGFSQFT